MIKQLSVYIGHCHKKVNFLKINFINFEESGMKIYYIAFTA